MKKLLCVMMGILLLVVMLDLAVAAVPGRIGLSAGAGQFSRQLHKNRATEDRLLRQKDFRSLYGSRDASAARCARLPVYCSDDSSEAVLRNSESLGKIEMPTGLRKASRPCHRTMWTSVGDLGVLAR